MKGRRRNSLFKILLGFMAGVIVALCLLVPGKVGPTVLVCGDERAQCDQLDRVGAQIESLSDRAVGYVGDAGSYVRERISNWSGE
ncbi:MAG: hypothetical protein JW936_09535 [Sedimentisphaerales bacterium]|nr:hypothetical protein [Sedimentisphaerales bacterium]